VTGRNRLPEADATLTPIDGQADLECDALASPVPLDARYRAASHTHAGLILVSSKDLPQDRAYTAAIAKALAALLDQLAQVHPGQVLFVPRR
jgi:hypothetical protein